MSRTALALVLLLVNWNLAAGDDNLKRMEWTVDGVARGVDLRPGGRQDHAQPRRVRLPWARRHDEERRREFRLSQALAGGHRRLHAGARTRPAS